MRQSAEADNDGEHEQDDIGDPSEKASFDGCKPEQRFSKKAGPYSSVGRFDDSNISRPTKNNSEEFKSFLANVNLQHNLEPDDAETDLDALCQKAVTLMKTSTGSNLN